MENVEEIQQKEPEKVKTFMFKLETSKIMKSSIETIASIIDETKFTITKKELRIEAMDPSRICLLRLTIKKQDFDEFECSENLAICLNLGDLDKILKRCSNNDTIMFKYSSDSRKIKIQMKREDAKRARTFSLSELQAEIEDIPFENLMNIEYSTRFKILPDILIEAIKDAEIYSEILNVKTTEDQGLIFSSIGQIGEMEYNIEPEDLIEENLTGREQSAYSLTFLKNILKIANITETLEISMKTDHPLKMDFLLLEGGELSYFLAPRAIDDLDDDDDYLDADDLYNDDDSEETE